MCQKMAKACRLAAQCSSWPKSIIVLLAAKTAGELIIVPNAPRYGVMFDAEDVRNKVFAWLDYYLMRCIGKTGQ
jgi:hypothetical protein